MSLELLDYLNEAIESAALSFDKNPVYSSANAEFDSAQSSFPASVTSSLACYGYSGININSLPTWLTSVPTSVVSIILEEQQIYQSIIDDFDAEAKEGVTSWTGPSASQPTISSNSPRIITSAVSTSVTSTSQPTTTSSSSAAILSSLYHLRPEAEY
ncbi:hypothetical protein N7540_006808 [Penicillium herquei]|nr:hypothetical protein N7540_006808 [Penicillium herquei]